MPGQSEVVVRREGHDGPPVDRAGGTGGIEVSRTALLTGGTDRVELVGDPRGPVAGHAPQTSAIAATSVSAMRSISSTVDVSMGISTTTSPSGRKSTPRRTA